MNYYEHHLGDYDGATAHLTWMEDCAYRRLICLYYRSEAPIPADVKQACRLVRAASKQERDAVQQVLSEFFELQGDGWHHKRCDEELARYHDKSAKARASVMRRWEKRSEHEGHPQSEGNTNVSTNAIRTYNEGNTPRARPQTPDTRHQYSEANASDAAASPPAPPPTPKDRVFAFGVPLLTASGVSDKNARSMLAGLCKRHGDEPVADAIDRCAREQAVEPVSWLQAALNGAGKGRPAGSAGKRRDIFEGLEVGG